MKTTSSLIILIACLSITPLRAQRLILEYSVSQDAHGFTYDFLLHPDEGWEPGMGWRWIVFGDCPGCDSPLADFVGEQDDLPIGPWTAYCSSGGGHNGPTLCEVSEYWIPESADDLLMWSGTSSTDVREGELLYSTLAGTLGGAEESTFDVAIRDGGGDGDGYGCSGHERIVGAKVRKDPNGNPDCAAGGIMVYTAGGRELSVGGAPQRVHVTIDGITLSKRIGGTGARAIRFSYLELGPGPHHIEVVWDCGAADSITLECP